MASNEPFFNWKTKLGLFILLLLICFITLDLGSLYGIKVSLQNSDIGEHHLHGLKLTLFNLFMLKILQLVIVSSAAFFLVYWILKPYRQLIQKIKKFAKQHPALKPLVKGRRNELGQANKVIKAVANAWQEKQNEGYPEEE